MERSPRKEARPRIAFIGIVSAAAACGSVGDHRTADAPAVEGVGDRIEHIEHGLLADLRFAARRDRIDAARERAAA